VRRRAWILCSSAIIPESNPAPSDRFTWRNQYLAELPILKLAFALLPSLTPGELLDPAQLHRLPPVFGLYWPIVQAESFHPLT
jgi:hypothetical protein